MATPQDERNPYGPVEYPSSMSEADKVAAEEIRQSNRRKWNADKKWATEIKKVEYALEQAKANNSPKSEIEWLETYVAGMKKTSPDEGISGTVNVGEGWVIVLDEEGGRKYLSPGIPLYRRQKPEEVGFIFVPKIIDDNGVLKKIKLKSEERAITGQQVYVSPTSNEALLFEKYKKQVLARQAADAIVAKQAEDLAVANQRVEHINAAESKRVDDLIERDFIQARTLQLMVVGATYPVEFLPTTTKLAQVDALKQARDEAYNTDRLGDFWERKSSPIFWKNMTTKYPPRYITLEEYKASLEVQAAVPPPPSNAAPAWSAQQATAVVAANAPAVIQQNTQEVAATVSTTVTQHGADKAEQGNVTAVPIAYIAEPGGSPSVEAGVKITEGPAEKPCPCKKKTPTDEELAAHAWCQTNSPVQNVVGKNAGALGKALDKSIAAFSIINDPTSTLYTKLGGLGVNTGKLDNMANNLLSMKNSVDLFKAEADRLSDPKNLMSLVGQMDLYGKIGCAFGIEGLDISAAASIVTEDGHSKISAMINVQADIDKMIGDPLDLGAIDDIAQGISEGMDKVTGAMNEGIGALNDLTTKANDLMAEAMLKISEFTQINFLINLVGDGNDPCNKLQAKISGNLLSPEFKEYAQRAYDSTHAPTDAGFR